MMLQFIRCVGFGLLVTTLSWGQAAQASTCNFTQWSGGIEFGHCPNPGLQIGRSAFTGISKREEEIFRISMIRRFDGVVAKYNSAFPAVYAHWERQQRVLAKISSNEGPGLMKLSGAVSQVDQNRHINP